MAVEIQVNPNTVQRAYDELEREGLIYSQRGRGLFVSEQGTASAQLNAGDGVRRSFDEAIRASLAAGMKTRQIRQIFHTALAQMTEANDSAEKKRTGEKRHD